VLPSRLILFDLTFSLVPVPLFLLVVASFSKGLPYPLHVHCRVFPSLPKAPQPPHWPLSTVLPYPFPGCSFHSLASEMPSQVICMPLATGFQQLLLTSTALPFSTIVRPHLPLPPLGSTHLLWPLSAPFLGSSCPLAPLRSPLLYYSRLYPPACTASLDWRCVS
jgi:hypothetical protein